MKYILFTFNSTKNSLIASSLLRDICINMPILREISSDCGIALKVQLEHKTHAILMLESHLSKKDFSIYEINGFGNNKIITFIR